MSFDAFQKMSTATAEATMTVDRDREFDQTAKTVTEPRHVSPAIHVHRINVLEQEKRDLIALLDAETVAHGKTQNKLIVAEIRIKQFENFTRTLAAKCDQMIERCEDLGVDILDLPPAVETPPAIETHADGVRETPSNPCNQVSPNLGRCIKARYHLGPCMTGAAA